MDLKQREIISLLNCMKQIVYHHFVGDFPIFFWTKSRNQKNNWAGRHSCIYKNVYIICKWHVYIYIYMCVCKFAHWFFTRLLLPQRKKDIYWTRSLRRRTPGLCPKGFLDTKKKRCALWLLVAVEKSGNIFFDVGGNNWIFAYLLIII